MEITFGNYIFAIIKGTFLRVKEYIAAIIIITWNVKMRKEERSIQIRNVDSKGTAVGKKRNLPRSF